MHENEFYRHAEQVVYGYRSAGLLERIVCEFWYLVCRRWSWILRKKEP
jgi:hypothetical protein